MIHTTSILATLLLIVAWAVEFYLFAITLRLVLGRLSATRSSRFCQAFREIVDPLAQCVNQRFTTWRHRPSPPWAPWAIVIVGCLAVRHLLLVIAVSMS